MQLSIDYDAAGIAVARRYTLPDGPDPGSERDHLAHSRVIENGAGQWIRHETDATTKAYTYDQLGRLTSVQDHLAGTGTCTTRAYTYNLRAGRTGKFTATNTSTSTSTGTSTAGAAGGCHAPSTTMPGQSATGYTYDSADRLVATTGAGATSGWRYDPFGRITHAPVQSPGAPAPGQPGSTVRNTFYVNDLIRSQEIAGVARATWYLDAIGRFTTYQEDTWNAATSTWDGPSTSVNHYDSDGDFPAWVQEVSSAEVTRYVDGLDGSLAYASDTGGTSGRDVVVHVIDLHGDVLATLPVPDTPAGVDSTTIATLVGVGNGRYRYDLVGNSHAGVKTPHKICQERNPRDPSGFATGRRSKIATPMTWRDLVMARSTLRRLGPTGQRRR